MMIEYMVVVMGVLMFGLASAATRKGFSMNTFLSAIVIGISILVWKEALPFYTMIVCALIIIGLLFRENDASGSVEV